jgi:hypothetical protein
MNEMTPEQKRRILSEAAFITIDGYCYRMDLCDETEFYYTDEHDGEQYCDTYEEIDLYEVELYKLQKIQIGS